MTWDQRTKHAHSLYTLPTRQATEMTGLFRFFLFRKMRGHNLANHYTRRPSAQKDEMGSKKFGGSLAGSMDCTLEMRQLGWAHFAGKGLQSEAEAILSEVSAHGR